MNFNLRASLNVRCINLFKISKSLRLPLYVKSYFATGRIMNVAVIDRVLMTLRMRDKGRPIIVIPDPKGKRVNQVDTNRLARSYNLGRTIIVINPIMSGYDHRILRLHEPVEVFSVGDLILSSGKVLIEIIVDSIDRYQISQKKGGASRDSLIKYGVPGSKNYGPPKSYRDLTVPSGYRLGNDDHFNTLRIREILS